MGQMVFGQFRYHGGYRQGSRAARAFRVFSVSGTLKVPL